MKTNTLFQVRFRPSVKPPKGFTKSAHYNVTDTKDNKVLIGNTWLPKNNFVIIEVEDAPVFQKPVLRKIASLKCDEVIECNTDAELKAIFDELIKQNVKGALNLFKILLEDLERRPICISVGRIGKNVIDCGNRAFYEMNHCTILPASKFVEVAKVEALPITQAQKDECVKLQERIKELEALCELRQQDIDNFADDLTDCNELINRMKELAKSSLSANNDMLNRAALRAIANGEI